MFIKRLVGIIVLLLIPSLAVGQSFPVTVTALWDLHPDTDAVQNYTVVLDTTAPVTVPASSCNTSTRTCQTTIVVPNNSNHTLTVTATNQWGTSAPTSLTFRVSVPAPATGIKVTK